MKDKTEEVTEDIQMVRVPLKTINEAMQYLATRPYNEVAGIISAIHSNFKTL